MKKNRHLLAVSLAVFVSLGWLLACGGTSVGNPQVTVRSNPLAGPNAASLGGHSFNLASLSEGLASAFFGIGNAWAAVSSFSKLEICFDTMTFDRTDGTTEVQNGSSNIVLNPGLMSFSPTSTGYMAIGSLNLTPGSLLKDVKLTVAVNPTVCNGAGYSVRFNSGVGADIDLTQNLAFRFDFPTSGDQVTGGQQTITLFLGAIVNGMVSLGSGLNNSTIQTVNVGQAQ